MNKLIWGVLNVYGVAQATMLVLAIFNDYKAFKTMLPTFILIILIAIYLLLIKFHKWNKQRLKYKRYEKMYKINKK